MESYLDFFFNLPSFGPLNHYTLEIHSYLLAYLQVILFKVLKCYIL